ncbi:hypothetical protein ACIA8O_38720 [Kitasatospora sp. NPDC051853]|uniref:hypothetical protein n=1 Tax=Kitasatospora sp. NPDC051853 TaxID=3364058 RepID=UPI0037A0DBA1
MHDDDPRRDDRGDATADGARLERAVDAVEAVIAWCHQQTGLERRRESPDAGRLAQLAAVRAAAKQVQRELGGMSVERLAEVEQRYADLLAELSGP